MYLIHGTLMRTVLAWMIYGILPQPWQEEVIGQNENGERISEIRDHYLSFWWTTVKGVMFVLWMALLVFISRLWRNYIDRASLTFIKYLEEVMTGERKSGIV
jgi:hypothetical protein